MSSHDKFGLAVLALTLGYFRMCSLSNQLRRIAVAMEKIASCVKDGYPANKIRVDPKP